ncbi:telomeric repeat-binding factor 2-interacting protein 1 [Betta splendens]|uniref:Telomeric repeat-binding factor 2-interacting protein 1 n=1 Tax=Betta splendens TaxID=158456 RepID=A0A6P7MKD0_BETSP|nr:telomeric repeat-binding factor 2-interacting protein 1 [Betta splendens]XP_029006892.1 telomeric repeat-binding factor 2-interacting protein 1 [Betta splendens]XP_029006893.1 telomeric repeat-binding factor 2-interacting protein 1 [Betta splendens]XP_029006894.1 telomeric repeat-binding factor 2-interacting protein 1 [Betta splendens]XP_029006895.1 telomeric repeat-binding factor 2-interacting protein 1 [Betta splendens]XP_029006896.1 telomeric repeat-binding factor 2-interacting protein 1
MPSTQQDVVQSTISPVLFMTTDGEAMCFYLRPGPAKRRMQPLITAGGGLMCSVQQPGAILLLDPEDRGSVSETTAHWYVSTKYVYDCIEKEEQLNLEHYRLNPEVGPRHSPRLSNKDGSHGLSGGRVAYSPEEDAAILSYVSQRKTETGGNRLWQEMEKQHVTSHSWQSMKYRYRTQLAKIQSEPEKTKSAEEENKDKENLETFQKPSCEEDAVPPQLPEVKPSAENDLTQVMDQPILAKSVEAQTLNSSDVEVQHVNPKNDVPTAEDTEVVTTDLVTPATPQPEGSCLFAETDVHPISPDSIDASAVALHNEDSAQPLPHTPSIKRKVKQMVSSTMQELQRRVTRRQCELEALSSSEPYGKKLRSSSNSAEKSSSTLQTPKKTKTPVKSAHKEDPTVGEPLSKRARGESVTAAVESHQEESEEAAISETPQTDEESTSLPHKAEKKKEKRKLGILELATREFEDESESGEDEAPDLQITVERVTIQPTSTEPCLPSSDMTADASPTRSIAESEPSLQSNAHNAQAASSNHISKMDSTKPEAAVHVASRAHLFIFDNDSQEDDSQSLISDDTAAAAQAVGNENTAPSLTQAQLEEDVQQIKNLMNQTNQDLVSVTKALLKTSGDISAALKLLSDPPSFSGPLWNHNDDSLLLSGDPNARQQLQEKYGEENLAKRVMFLEVEG